MYAFVIIYYLILIFDTYSNTIILDLYCIVCPEGLYGHECSMICECSIRGTCLAHDGSCDCEPGWIDKTCETSKNL